MYEYRVHSIERVLDGDTFDCAIDLGFGILYRARVRMNGIDTPEVHTTDTREKNLGIDALHRLQELLLQNAGAIRVLTQKPDSTEKFGRVLADVYIGNQGRSVNEQMVDEGFAWEYHGEAKVKDLDALVAVRTKRAAEASR